MSPQRDDKEWLLTGRQRAALAQALRKPMSASEICVAARAINPHIQLRDVWYLLRQMEARRLVVCHNPRLVTGRLYEFTARGRLAVTAAFGISILPATKGVDWRKYSWVVRAKIRRLTLVGLHRLEMGQGTGQTLTRLRKYLCSEHPVGLSPVMHAIQDLLKLGLVRIAGVTQERQCKLYRLTPSGGRIVEALQR